MNKNVQIEKLLSKFGWNEKRNINISNLEKILHDEGYCIFEEANTFLKQYGMLKIKYENPRMEGHILTVDLDPEQAVSSIFRSVPESYEKYFREIFVIVGEIERENMTIYMTNKGNFYGGFDDSILKLGTSFYDALYNLVNGVELDLIIVPSE